MVNAGVFKCFLLRPFTSRISTVCPRIKGTRGKQGVALCLCGTEQREWRSCEQGRPMIKAGPDAEPNRCSDTSTAHDRSRGKDCWLHALLEGNLNGEKQHSPYCSSWVWGCKSSCLLREQVGIPILMKHRLSSLAYRPRNVSNT